MMMNVLKNTCLSTLLLLGGTVAATTIAFTEGTAPEACAGATAAFQKYEKLMLGGQTSPLTVTFSIDQSMGVEAWKIASSQHGIQLTGGSTRGILYATYHYLEDVCGVRFLSQRDEFIPALKELPSQGLMLKGEPLISQRSMLSTVDRDGGEFPSKNYLNTLGSHDFKLQYGGGVKVIPGPCHTFQYIFPASKANLTDHPDFFSMNAQGKRVTFGDPEGQLCLSNPNLRKEIIRLLTKQIKDYQKTVKDTRLVPLIVELSQNDNQSYCRCEECTKLAKKYGNTQSGVMIDFVNEIATALDAVHPGVMVQTFAYQYTEQEPTGIKPAPNVIVRLCDTRGNMAAPITDPSNTYFRKRLKAWGKLGKVSVWDYDATYAFPGNLPIAPEFFYADNFRYLKKNNTYQLFNENDMYHYPNAQEYRHFMASRLLDNPNQDVTKLSDSFIRPYYGKAAPHFKKYRKILYKSAQKRQSFLTMYPSIGCYTHLNLNTLTRLQKLFDQGREAVKDDPKALKHWNDASIGVDRAILWRSLAIKDEMRRLGIKQQDFPFDLQKIVERVKPHHVAYVNLCYSEMPQIKRYLTWKANTLKDLEEEYQRIHDIMDSQTPEIPSRFAHVPAKDLYVFHPYMTEISRRICTFEKDAKTIGKLAIRFSEKVWNQDGKARNISVEHYRYHPTSSVTCGGVKVQDIPADSYRWFKVGTVKDIMPSSLITLFGWNYILPVGEAWQPKQSNDFDCWMRFQRNGKDLQMDCAILVRKH